MEEKCPVCDTKQREFGAAACSYFAEVDELCNTYSTQYDTDSESFDDEMERVDSLESSQKEVLKSVQKIRCYIAVLEKAEESQLTQEDINNCVNIDHNLAKLDTTTPDKPDKEPCSELFTIAAVAANEETQKLEQTEIRPLKTDNKDTRAAWKEHEFGTDGNKLLSKSNLEDKIEEPLSCTVHTSRKESDVTGAPDKPCTIKSDANGACKKVHEFQLDLEWTTAEDCFTAVKAESECKQEGGAISARDAKCNCLRKTQVCEKDTTVDVAFYNIECAVDPNYDGQS